MKKNIKKQIKHKNFISIKTKLLVIILPIVIAICIVLTSLSYNVSRDIIKSYAQELLETSVESQVAKIEAYLDLNLRSVKLEKQAIEQMNFDDKQLQDFLNSYYGFDSNYPEGVYIADTSGKIYKGQSAKKFNENIILREPDKKGNYVNNGDFAVNEDLTDNENWQFITNLGGKATTKIKNNKILLNVENEGSVDYSIQLVQANLPIKEKATYKVSFDAYADEDRTIQVTVSAPDRDYQRYLDNTIVNLTTKKQTFVYEFTMMDVNDTNGRLEFNLGAAGSTASVNISNVSVVKINEPIEEESTDNENIDLEEKSNDITQSEWFKDGLTRVNIDFTHAYTNEDGEQVISACGMLRTNSDKVHVISADLSLDRVSVYVNSFVEMKDAEAFLVNTKDNTILASHDRSLISKELKELNDDFMNAVSDKILQNELDLAEINGNMSIFKQVEGTEWVLVSYIPTKTIYHNLDKIRSTIILFGLIFMIILAILVERIVHIVINPVKKLTDAIESMTDGDFTIHIKTKSHDEIGIMSNCVDKFINTMRKVISSINGVSHQLHNQADNSNDLSNQMFDASKKQSQSMKELNVTVEQLSDSVNEIAQNATTLSIVVAETKDNGYGVNKKMKETVDISKKGKEDMQDVSVAMQNINNSVNKLHLAIDEVGKVSEEITNITKVIADIADETNLLALNASIEAARAGEAGKGFTVVASEIGKLAQTSMKSVQNIDSLVLKIKTSVGDVINQANDSVGNINSSNILIENALKTFDTIFGNVATVGELVQQMIEKVDQVEDVSRSVAAVSDQWAASSQEIRGSSDALVEQANSLMINSETVAKESKELSTSAEELATQIGTFKID